MGIKFLMSVFQKNGYIQNACFYKCSKDILLHLGETFSTKLT